MTESDDVDLSTLAPPVTKDDAGYSGTCQGCGRPMSRQEDAEHGCCESCALHLSIPE